VAREASPDGNLLLPGSLLYGLFYGTTTFSKDGF